MKFNRETTEVKKIIIDFFLIQYAIQLIYHFHQDQQLQI